jgi:selenocysteine-specific elongation factor
MPARVRLLGTESLAPGETGWAQLRLSSPAALVRGDRFIVRWLSPSITVGGGVVVDPAPRRRHRRFRPEVIARLETLAHGTPQEIILQALDSRQPREARELFEAVSLPAETVEGTLRSMLREGQILLVDDETSAPEGPPNLGASNRFLVSSFGWRELAERMRGALSAYHRARPLRKGMPREELRSRLQERTPQLSGRLFNQLVNRAAREGLVREDETSVWAADHNVEFSPEQQRRVDDLLALFRRAPYTTPSVSDCVERVGEEVFNALIEDGQLVRLNEDVVYLSDTLAEMEGRIVGYIRQQGDVTVAQARDLLDVSRKYALALLEYMDEKRVTRRVGDVRVLR